MTDPTTLMQYAPMIMQMFQGNGQGQKTGGWRTDPSAGFNTYNSLDDGNMMGGGTSNLRDDIIKAILSQLSQTQGANPQTYNTSRSGFNNPMNQPNRMYVPTRNMSSNSSGILSNMRGF